MVDRAKDYPPWRREMILWYDHVAGRAKVVTTDDLHAGKTFLRMYDLKKDYMLRGGEYASCRRSYLGEYGAILLNGRTNCPCMSLPVNTSPDWMICIKLLVH